MLETSIEKIRSELGEWDTNTQIEFVILIDEKNRFNSFNNQTVGRVKLFSRPNGLQLTTLNNGKNFSFPFDDVSGIELSNEVYLAETKEKPFLSTLISGIIFCIIGELLGGPNVGLYWLPIGLLYGLLGSKYFSKKHYEKKVTIIMEDTSKVYLAFDYNDNNKVVEFFRKNTGTKFMEINQSS